MQTDVLSDINIMFHLFTLLDFGIWRTSSVSSITVIVHHYFLLRFMLTPTALFGKTGSNSTNSKVTLKPSNSTETEPLCLSSIMKILHCMSLI